MKQTRPQVGIFWIDDDGTMFSSSVSLNDAVDYAECLTFEGSHYELWSKAVIANPQWRDKEYEEIPRGRVVCFKDRHKQQFVVYLPKRIKQIQEQGDSPIPFTSASPIRYDG
ncbi:MAG: hypothetical protein WCN95_04275 [bacterium]